jgi:hypothetical protein
MLNEFQSPRRAKNKEEQMCMCYVAQIEPLLPAIKRTRVCPATGAPAIQTPAAQWQAKCERLSVLCVRYDKDLHWQRVWDFLIFKHE